MKKEYLIPITNIIIVEIGRICQTSDPEEEEGPGMGGPGGGGVAGSRERYENFNDTQYGSLW